MLFNLINCPPAGIQDDRVVFLCQRVSQRWEGFSLTLVSENDCSISEDPLASGTGKWGIPELNCEALIIQIKQRDEFW